jgi:hypothetical protein
MVETVRGRVIFHAALSEVLRIFRLQQWFASDLELDDFMLFDDERCIIMKQPTKLDSTWLLAKGSQDPMYLGRQSNLKSVWLMMSIHYSVNDVIPLFFNILRDELLLASISDVQHDCFFDYLENQFALKPSIARRDFITHTSKLCRMFHLIENVHLKAVLTAPTRVFWREKFVRSVISLFAGYTGMA